MRRGSVAAALVGLALAASACSGPGGDLAQRVAAWSSAAGLAANDAQIAADIKGIALGVERRELAPTRTACAAFVIDAGTAEGVLPTPDTQLTNALNEAYTDFAEGAEACSLASSFSSPGFARYRARIAAGQAHLATAERLVKALGGG
ncbi:MAG TPA: hypothetical protein VMU75_10580 [Acidimicrobiales bacterium]|nr:hypothetical protein [Acidimicrobiales bacterium]